MLNYGYGIVIGNGGSGHRPTAQYQESVEVLVNYASVTQSSSERHPRGRSRSKANDEPDSETQNDVNKDEAHKSIIAAMSPHGSYESIIAASEPWNPHKAHESILNAPEPWIPYDAHESIIVTSEPWGPPKAHEPFVAATSNKAMEST